MTAKFENLLISLLSSTLNTGSSHGDLTTKDFFTTSILRTTDYFH